MTVTGPDDDNAVEETATITHSIGGIVASGILRVTMDESDTRGVTVTPTSIEVTENGTARYNIVLDSQPVGDAGNRVTVTVGGASGDVTVAPSQLVFTDDDWFTAQEVEVSAALDNDGEPDAPVTLTPHGARRGLRTNESGQRQGDGHGNTYTWHHCGYDAGAGGESGRGYLIPDCW